MASGRRRPIKKARLRALVGDNNRAIAKKLAGDGAPRERVEQKRRELLRYLATDGESSVMEMTESTGMVYARALGVSPDDFLEPATDPREAELARLEARVQQLRHELGVGHD